VTDKFFHAVSIDIARCTRVGCTAVHIHLLDADGVARAQAVMACENIDDLVAALIEVRDHPGRYSRAGLH
jgi:hypothetical protein